MKTSLSSRFVAGALAVLGTAMLMQPVISAAQVGSTPVRVVNTPLQVTVTNPGAVGGVLGPAKASDLVTIQSSGVKCGGTPWRMLDTQINGDGTLTPFVIPAGKVLIVTSIDFRQGATGSSGRSEEFFLFPSAANISNNSAIVDLMSVPGSSSGQAGGSFAISGVALKAGNPCWGINNIAQMGSASTLVHGYLALDQ